jgi:hypothetical protein
MLRGSGDLHHRIVRNLGRSTVALFAISRSHGGDLLKLAGTGTLAVVGDSYGILTAAHVWEDVLKSAVKLGITLTDNINHKRLMDISTLVPTELLLFMRFDGFKLQKAHKESQFAHQKLWFSCAFLAA